MAGDERNPRAADLFRNRTRLLRIAGVILDVEHELLAQQPTRSIEVGDRHLGTVLHLAAERRLAAGHRPRYGDGDVLGKRCRRQRKRCAQCQADELQ